MLSLIISAHGSLRFARHCAGLLVTLALLAGCSDDSDDGKASGGAGGGSGGSSGASGSGGSSGAAGSAAAGGNGGSAGTGGSAGNGGNAGSAGSAGNAGTGSSCLPDYLLCEDFEDTPVGDTPDGWTKHGDATVADDQANRGTRSLKIGATDNGERRIHHPATMVGAAHWGRVHYRVQLPVPDAFVHSTLVTFFGEGPTVGDAEFRVVDTVKDAKTGGFANGKHQFLYNVQPNGPEFGTGSDYDYDFEDEWHCAEWNVDAADQSYHFYYDGQEVIGFTNGAGNYEGSELPNGFETVRLGWNNYQSAPPGFTAWLDDFAIDDQRVGCLP